MARNRKMNAKKKLKKNSKISGNIFKKRWRKLRKRKIEEARKKWHRN